MPFVLRLSNAEEQIIKVAPDWPLASAQLHAAFEVEAGNFTKVEIVDEQGTLVWHTEASSDGAGQ